MLQKRFPELVQTYSPNMHIWVKLFILFEGICLMGATFGAFSHIVYATSTRTLKNPNPVGLFLCLALWAETFFLVSGKLLTLTSRVGRVFNGFLDLLPDRKQVAFLTSSLP
jgi:hypothetical protein